MHNFATHKVALKQDYTVKDKARSFFLTKAENDTVAVLIHGFTGSPYDMIDLADFLHGRGVDVMVVRIAGHGTAVQELMNTSYGDWWRSVKDAIQHVESSHKRLFLIGYSFGANIILDLAAREPDRYQGIVCLGTSIYLRYSWYYDFVSPVLRLLGFKIVRKPYVPKSKIETFESGGNYAYVPLRSLAAMRKFTRLYTKKELHRVTTPTLIIHSRDDRISHPRSSEYLFERVGSPYKEMFILNELNHNPLRSDNKNKIFTRIIQFLES